MAKGRDGKKYEKNVAADVKTMRQKGITLIICLISDIEIRSIGCSTKEYGLACLANGIELFMYPIIEMSPPTDLDYWN